MEKAILKRKGVIHMSDGIISALILVVGQILVAMIKAKSAPTKKRS